MRDKITYEWCLNNTNAYGDIQDIRHFEVTLDDTISHLMENE